MSVFVEMMSTVRDNAKGILVSPEFFYELMKDPETTKAMILTEDGVHKVDGLPIVIDRDTVIFRVVYDKGVSSV